MVWSSTSQFREPTEAGGSNIGRYIGDGLIGILEALDDFEATYVVQQGTEAAEHFALECDLHLDVLFPCCKFKLVCVPAHAINGESCAVHIHCLVQQKGCTWLSLYYHQHLNFFFRLFQESDIDENTDKLFRSQLVIELL